MKSPYESFSVDKWHKITENLLRKYPLEKDDIVNVVLECWETILKTKIGKYRIGKDIFPSPQVMGFFLHELIPLTFSEKYRGQWRKDQNSSEKDLVYISDLDYSLEIKTSSHKSKIYGNRSYSQTTGASKKDKSGFYLAINFEKFDDKNKPKIRIIRFGWIDHNDWKGQKAQSGQQSSLSSDVEENKLIVIYEVE